MRGATLHGADGMIFGPDGNLYVAVGMGSEIVALDPSDGAIVARFGPTQGVVSPDEAMSRLDAARLPHW